MIPPPIVLPITVVIPAHPERAANGMLARAVESVTEQTALPAAVLVEIDADAQGAAAVKNRALRAVQTPFVAFLDSDDWFYPDHLQTLWEAAQKLEAEYVYSYFTVHDQYEAARPDLDPLNLFGVTFDSRNPTQTTTTILVRTELARLIGFRHQPADRFIDGTTLRYGEDYDFTVRAAAYGAVIAHWPARTWAWRHHLGNTAGLPGTGDADGNRILPA